MNQRTVKESEMSRLVALLVATAVCTGIAGTQQAAAAPVDVETFVATADARIEPLTKFTNKAYASTYTETNASGDVVLSVKQVSNPDGTSRRIVMDDGKRFVVRCFDKDCWARLAGEKTWKKYEYEQTGVADLANYEAISVEYLTSVKAEGFDIDGDTMSWTDYYGANTLTFTNDGVAMESISGGYMVTLALRVNVDPVKVPMPPKALRR